jgi:hypothetical protein
MGMYKIFETDAQSVTEGVWIDYGEFRIRIAQAGQSNKSYLAYAERKLKPIRKALDVGAVPPERQRSIMIDVFAKTIILNWEVQIKDKKGEITWRPGIEAKDGSILPFNEENVIKTLNILPELFLDIQEQAGTLANFRKSELEEDSKNS